MSIKRREVIHVIEGLLGEAGSLIDEEAIPSSCGACGTPNSSCDMDCSDNFYMNQHNARVSKAIELIKKIKELPKPNPFVLDTVAFKDWWSTEGMYIDPDTEDVPWFDKRKELAEHAFKAGRHELKTSITKRKS